MMGLPQGFAISGMGKDPCATRKFSAVDGCFGLKADIPGVLRDVRFTPKADITDGGGMCKKATLWMRKQTLIFNPVGKR